MLKRRAPVIGLIERAFIEKEWRATTVSAQIHALMGDDSDKFVGAAGRVLYVVLGALAAEGVDHEMVEVRIIRGACNAIYEQAGDPTIPPARRASILAGLDAADRLIPALSRRSLNDAACDLALKMRTSHVLWGDFEKLVAGVAA